ncbi:hypothetical protein CC1G_13919 [Coprinopsis cinerea okayama7|uniref:Uncharacterized protein n=1 Tax=Coprinopsis cinerea (strain Okayama-7 / 130 / ATCC MYA-4618 / FGSC 9003) TaxID=240176 RepID=D6RKG9_COPC7|nr:hypothetical protein CC1G_13919 [Coprinopsis cinerea okayama7\|eukprot:XP_002911879.1 hypothetical protein CC1G_13919 [Coprinopsis cinerea okayama7\
MASKVGQGGEKSGFKSNQRVRMKETRVKGKDLNGAGWCEGCHCEQVGACC